MDTVQDFEDMLDLLERFEVRYLIIGGLAFIYHAKPRFTKDIDLWIGPAAENVHRANRGLAWLQHRRFDGRALPPCVPARRLQTPSMRRPL